MTGERDAARDRMLAGVPVTERRLEPAGVSTLVLEGGDGPPLVLLHGGIECGGAYWAPVLARISERHRLVVPDVPGLGESSPVDGLDVDTFAAWFVALLELTHAERPTLVAHSLLGSAAARFATRHSNLLQALVLCGAPGVGRYRMPMRLRYVAIRFAIRPTARNAEQFDRFALLDLDATRRRDPGWYAAFDDYTRSRATEPHVKRTMRRLIAAETRQIPDTELGRITVPTSLLWGRHDRMVPLPLAQRAASRHSWPLQVIDGAAHAPHLEQPDAFLDALSAIENESTKRKG